MEQTSDWQWFHAYCALARAGYCKPIVCEQDQQELIPVLGQDEELSLILWCPSCDTLTTPGLDFMSMIRAVVNEHREDYI